MKKIEICIILVLYVLITLAQPPESFKYQAVARDNTGNPLTNKTMAFRISILNGTATAGAVYIEDHQKTTNGFGLVDLEIGKGTVRAGTFSTIEWGKDLFYVKVEMDPQGGVAFQHLGTSQLLSVPYAFHAKTFESVITDATLSGNGSTTPLKIAWQSASVGQVLKWNGAIWKPAADEIGAGVATPPAGTQGNIQFNNSGVFAADANLHWDNTSKSLGIGTATPAALLHTYGTAKGGGNVVFVGENKSSSPGNPPVSGAGTRMMWYPDKAAFRVGYINGNQWDADNVGTYSISMGYGTIASGICSNAMGCATSSSGPYSTAMGYGTTASGPNSIAMGYGSTASGQYSISMGNGTTASGLHSTAMGGYTTASGRVSITMGAYTTASGYCSTALGRFNVGGGNPDTWVGTDPLFEIGNGAEAKRNNAMTVLKNGQVGIGTATPSAGLHIKGKGWPESFAYLESESGQDAGIRLNEGGNKKWQIYSDSHSGPNGLHFVNGAGQSCMFINQSSTNVGIGSDSPSYKLDVAGALNLNSGISWGAALHCNGAQALWYDGTYFSWGYGGTYNYFADKVTIGNAANPGNYMLYVQGNAFTTGTWSTSDMRFKKEIKEIESPLEKVMKMKGVTYEYRTGEFPEYRFSEGRHAGCIAQEIEKVLPEAVLTDNNGYKSLNYSELIPLLLEAVKEQQNTIDRMKADFAGLKTRYESTEKENRLILERLSNLETMMGVNTAKR